MADVTESTNAPDRPRPVKRDAMIFVPGLGDHTFGPDQTVEGVARRISNALNICASTASAAFRTEVREQAYGPHDCYKARVATVFRRDDAKEEALLDLYGMDYNQTLTCRFERQNVLLKFLFTLWQFVSGLGLLRRSQGKTFREKAQVLYAGVVLLGLAAYMVMLVAAAVDVGVNALRAGQATPRSSVQTGAKLPDDRGRPVPWREVIRGSIVVLAALGVVFPINFKAHLNTAATAYLCSLYYLRLGERRNELVAQLEALIERTAELEGGDYDRTHILAYSFGTVIATDALFRLGTDPPPLRFRRVNTFITIGFPFDFIRTYWPSYFQRRTPLPSESDGSYPPTKWMNIYSPLDILGSNFRDDGNPGPALQGVQLVGEGSEPGKRHLKKPNENVSYGAGPESPESLKFRDYLMFIGFRVHSLYWNREDEPSTDCFTRVVQYLYKDEPALR